MGLGGARRYPRKRSGWDQLCGVVPSAAGWTWELQEHLPPCGGTPNDLWKATLRLSDWLEPLGGVRPRATGSSLGRRAANSTSASGSCRPRPPQPLWALGRLRRSHFHSPGSCPLALEEATSQAELPGHVLRAQETGVPLQTYIPRSTSLGTSLIGGTPSWGTYTSSLPRIRGLEESISTSGLPASSGWSCESPYWSTRWGISGFPGLTASYWMAQQYGHCVPLKGRVILSLVHGVTSKAH